MGAAILLCLFGLLTVSLSLQLPVGNFRAPGSGLFPLILGLLLMGLSAVYCLQLLRARDAATGSGAGRRATSGYVRVLLFLGAVAAATALMKLLGYPLVAFLLLLALMEILGVRPRMVSVLVSLLTAGASYALFVRWLQIPLPAGWIGL